MRAGEFSCIERFLENLRVERGLSPHTRAAYRRDLRALAGYCDEQGLAEWPALNGNDIRALAAQEHRRGLAPRSIRRRLSAIRTFFRFLRREGVVKRNPADGIRAPKADRHLPGTLDPDTMARLLDIRGDDPLTIRDRAMLELLYSSGLRLAELVGLDLGDLRLDDATVEVRGKGGKERIVPVGRHAREALQGWLRTRVALASVDEKALFVGRGGRRLGARGVQARVRHWARRQGIDSRVYPHLFRHSFATHLLESSGELRGVQELLGHADVGTTQIYTHLDFQHLAQIYDSAHPRARRRDEQRSGAGVPSDEFVD